MYLSEIQIDESGIITKIKGRSVFRNRIKELGFVVGKEVCPISFDAGNEHVEYDISGVRTIISKVEAHMIEVVSGKKGHTDPDTTSSSTNFNQDLQVFAARKSKCLDITLLGNPDSGKQLFLDYISRSNGDQEIDHIDIQHDKVIRYERDGYEFSMRSLPETTSLFDIPSESLEISKYFFEDTPDVVINILNSANLEKHLFLTTQLIDLGIKVIIALNTYDELLKRGDRFDHKSLAKMIGIPIIPVNFKTGCGLKELFQSAVDIYEDKDPFVRHVHIDYGKTVEKSIRSVQDKIRLDQDYTDIVSSRYLAIKLLESDESTREEISDWPTFQPIIEVTEQEVPRIKQMCNEEAITLITGARHGFISGALKETFLSGESRKYRTETVDSFMTHRLFGYPIFLTFMFIMFFSTFEIGQYPMDWLDRGINMFSGWLQMNMAEGALKDLIIEGIVGGVGSVIIFLPNILILFFFISLMEDTGYMARAAFIMDKVMHKIGLHGRSFIPLLMGFGCNVPAIMATRTIENRNNRILTILINPFMSCSARLPVYILLIGAFFPGHPGLILFLMYFIGIVLATIVAITFKKIFFKTEEIPYVMELPPYHVPSFQTILIHMWQKGVQYLKKMGGIIFIASVIIWALGYYPKEVEYVSDYDQEMTEVNEHFADKSHIFSFGSSEYTNLETERDSQIQQLLLKKEAERHEKSYIGKIGHFMEPVLKPIGFDWKMGVSLLSGIAAKEIVVSTMGVLYQAPANSDGSTDSLIDKLREQSDGSEEKIMDTGFTPVVAFGFMIFILTYFPCVAVIAAIRKETGSWKWALFTIIYTTVLAWFLAFIVYQGGSLIF